MKVGYPLNREAVVHGRLAPVASDPAGNRRARDRSTGDLVRDRETWLNYAQQGAFGYFQFGFGPSMLLFQEESGVSHTVAGLYGPALALGALLGGALFPRLTRHLGLRGVLSTGLAGLAGSVSLYCLVPSVAGTLVAAVLAMGFGILVLSGVSAGLAEHHGPASAAALSEANAASAGMGIIAPVVISVAVDAGLNWRTGMALAIVLPGLLALYTALGAQRSAGADGEPEARGPAGVRGALPRRYWLAWLCLLAVMSTETAMLLWSAQQLREYTGIAAGTAGLGVSALLGGMLAGRLAGGWLVARVPTVPLLFAALAVSAAGFTIFWATDDPTAAISGLVCCGVGMSLHFPLSVSLTLRVSNDQPELAMSRNAFGIAFGLGAAPFLLGALADMVGIRMAFTIVPACLLIAALAVAQLTRLPIPADTGEHSVRRRSQRHTSLLDN